MLVPFGQAAFLRLRSPLLMYRETALSEPSAVTRSLNKGGGFR
jgi:hypothetical protein